MSAKINAKEVLYSVTNRSVHDALLGKQKKLIAGQNITIADDGTISASGGGGGSDPDAVKYTAQSRSETEKAQARTNIGAVAAESGKGLSTNDYTTAEKNKLAGIDVDYTAQTVKANGRELGTNSNPILNATHSEFADSADQADADGDGNSITATYATKTELNNGLSGKLNMFQSSDAGKCVIIKNDGTLNPVSSADMSVGYAENANDANTIDGHEYTEFATASHNHDDRYYTESEIDTALSGKAAASHTHDDRYYTTSQMDAALAAKAPNSHSHTKSQITDFAHDHQISQIAGLTTRLTDIEDDVDGLETSTAGISTALSNHVNAPNPHGITAAGIGAAAASHDHDGRYYTETEINTKLDGKQNTLVSGTNIKTINNQSLLGNGNIVIQGGGGEANVIEVVKRNGTVLTVTDKAVDVSVPTQPSDIGAAAASHDHDDRYYTTSQMDSALATKAPSSHAHTKSQITDFAHDHDDRYYTESETDTLLDTKQPTLVSGNNIKTVNSQSLLGSTNVKCSYVAEITNPSFPILTPSVTKTDTEMDEMGFTASVLADIMNGWVGRCKVVWDYSEGMYSEIYTVDVAYKMKNGDYEFHLYSNNIIDDSATYYKIEYDHISGNFTISVTEK